MRLRTLQIFILLLIFLLPQPGYAQEDERLYSQALESVRSGDLDFAFIGFHAILNLYPQSQFLENALFAVGEYYFSIANYNDAARTFNRFVNSYPESAAQFFALAYLLKIARIQDNEDLARNLQKEIISSQRLSLLFRDFKEYKYCSPSSKSYKAAYFIERIEFYIDEGLFAKVSY